MLKINVALLPVLLFGAVVCADARQSPSIKVSPDRALIDERVEVRAYGLPPRKAVTIRARMKDGEGREWQSEASFLADGRGRIDLGRQPPTQGDYRGVDAMGLFWSMKPVASAAQSAPPRRPFIVRGVLRETVMEFELLIENRSAASARLLRYFVAPEVRISEVREDGLVGRFYEPAQSGRRHPAVIVLGGSGGGGVPDRIAPLLASRGYAVLALAYFGVEPLPPKLSEVPLEYFQRGIGWLRARPSVDGERLGVLGVSKGGELALLLGSMFPELKAVVGYVPSGIVWEAPGLRANGVMVDPKSNKSPWSYGGRPLPFLPKTVTDETRRQVADNPLHTAGLYLAALSNREAAEEFAIHVEKINGAVLLLSAKDDFQWPSYSMSEMVVERLRRRRHRFPFQNLGYENAGHIFEEAYLPTTQTSRTLGGTPEGNARAQRDSWPRVLRFLKENLARRK